MVPPDLIRWERARLLVEECAELVAEILAGLPERHDMQSQLCDLFADRSDPLDRRPLLERVAQEQADLEYVLAGAAVNWGIPLDAAVAEVHRANMAKVGPDGPVWDEHGKAVKPPGWTPPDMGRVIRGVA